MLRLKKIVIWIVLPICILIFSWKLSRSNTEALRLKNCDDDGIETIRVLNQLVKKNYLNREYYEVWSYSDFGPCFAVNYNTQHQVMLLSSDPPSGWYGYYQATPKQLQNIVDLKIVEDSLPRHLKSLPDSVLKIFPSTMY